MYLNQTIRRQRRLNDMLPCPENHLRFRIPNFNLNWHVHIPNWADDNNARRYLCTIGDILIRPIYRCLLTRSLRIPHIKLVVVCKNCEAATMTWSTHDLTIQSGATATGARLPIGIMTSNNIPLSKLQVGTSYPRSGQPDSRRSPRRFALQSPINWVI